MATSKPMILIIEDDKPIRNFICTALGTQGYAYKEATNGQEGMTLFMSYNPDLILLDLGLPDQDGIEVLKSIRKWSQVPIMIVSARSQEREKVEALDYGADDYLSKPFGVSELLARIRVVLRRQQNQTNEEHKELTQLTIGELNIDFDKRRVKLKEQEIHLTPIEFKIVAVLAKHQGKVLTHNYMIKEVWGVGGGSETQSLRVFMANLRRKIEDNPAEPRYIITEVGVGYRLADE